MFKISFTSDPWAMTESWIPLFGVSLSVRCVRVVGPRIRENLKTLSGKKKLQWDNIHWLYFPDMIRCVWMSAVFMPEIFPKNLLLAVRKTDLWATQMQVKWAHKKFRRGWTLSSAEVLPNPKMSEWYKRENTWGPPGMCLKEASIRDEKERQSMWGKSHSGAHGQTTKAPT